MRIRFFLTLLLFARFIWSKLTQFSEIQLKGRKLPQRVEFINKSAWILTQIYSVLKPLALFITLDIVAKFICIWIAY